MFDFVNVEGLVDVDSKIIGAHFSFLLTPHKHGTVYRLCVISVMGVLVNLLTLKLTIIRLKQKQHKQGLQQKQHKYCTILFDFVSVKGLVDFT